MKPMAISLIVVLVTAPLCLAVPITLFTDVDTFVERAQDIVVAKCTGPVPDVGNYDDGLYPVEVQIVAVVKGAKKSGRATIATIYPVEAGKSYLLTSLGGSAYGTDFLAIPQLAVVELPSNFRLDDLKNKKPKEQVQAVFTACRHEIERQQRALDAERRLLDQAAPE